MRVLLSALALLALANCVSWTKTTVQPTEPVNGQTAQGTVAGVDTSAVEAAGQ